MIFFSRLRIAPKETLSGTERLLLLELLASFIIMNGGVRFPTGIPESEFGGRVAVQLDRWRKALLAFRALTECGPVVRPLSPKQLRLTGCVFWGYPVKLCLLPMS